MRWSSKTGIPRQLHLFVTTAEAARVLEVTAAQVARLCRDGVLEGTRFGTAWGVAIADVERYRQERGAWRPLGVVGGKAAAVRLGVVVDGDDHLRIVEQGGA